MVKDPTALRISNQHDESKPEPEAYIGGKRADASPKLLMSKDYRHLFERMLDLLRNGATLRAAAGCIGIEQCVIDGWLQKADKLAPSTAFGRFARRVNQARMQARSEAETRIIKRDPKAWLQANAADTWHPESQSTQITIDNRRVAYVEQISTGDLAKTLAVLEGLGLANTLTSETEGAQPPTLSDRAIEQDQNVIEAKASKPDERQQNDSG